MELPWSGRAGAGVCGGETGGSLSHSGMGMGCFVSAGFKVWAILVRVLFHVFKSDDTSRLSVLSLLLLILVVTVVCSPAVILDLCSYRAPQALCPLVAPSSPIPGSDSPREDP